MRRWRSRPCFTAWAMVISCVRSGMPGQKHAHAVRMAAGHHAGPRRRATRMRGVEAVEAQARGGHGVEVGRLDLLQAVVADVAPALVIRHAEDDVRLACARRVPAPRLLPGCEVISAEGGQGPDAQGWHAIHLRYSLVFSSSHRSAMPPCVRWSELQPHCCMPFSSLISTGLVSCHKP